MGIFWIQILISGLIASLQGDAITLALFYTPQILRVDAQVVAAVKQVKYYLMFCISVTEVDSIVIPQFKDARELGGKN